MRKFLTVLLVIAVMFTFSFSAAFAATSADTAAVNTVSEEQTAMAKAVNDYAATIIYNQAGYLVSAPGVSPVDTNLTQDAVKAGIAAIIADYNTKIQDKAIEVVADGDFTATDEADVEAAWKTALDGQVGNVLFTTYAGAGSAMYTKAVGDAVAKAEALIAGVDASAYENATTVKGIVATLQSAVNEVTKDAAGLSALVGKIADFETAMAAQKTVAERESALAEEKSDALNDITEAVAAFKTSEAERLQDIINSTTSTTAEVADAKAKLAALDTNVAAVQAIYTAKVSAIVIDDDTNYTAASAAVAAVVTDAETAFNNATNFYVQVDKLAGVDLLVAYAETLASNLKNAYSATTGLAIYNASTVDKYLANTVAKIKALEIVDYANVGVAMTVPTAADEAAALSGAVTAGKTAITTSTYDAALWSGDNKEAVEAIQEAYTAKIEKAASADEIDALVEEAQKAMDAYLKDSQITTLLGSLSATLDSYRTALTNYGNGVIAVDLDGKYTQGQVADAVADAMELLTNAILAEQDADMTIPEAKAIIEANYSKALAVIDGMKTDDELAAEKKAVEDAIDGLATTPTLDNAAAYLAVKDMLDAYNELPGAEAISAAKLSKLNSYITRLTSLAKAEVEALINDLPTVITTADEAAVEAAQAAVKALDEEWNAAPAPYYATKLANAVADLRAAQTIEAAKLIAALPDVITLDDQAAVEAARAAFDAIDEEGQEAFSTALKTKLEAAEATLAKLGVFNDVAAKAYVQDLEIVARSVKTAKGNIKVTINADVQKLLDNGYTVEYKFYRSEKARSGYGKARIVKTTNTYTNTTGVKGTRYYYKAVLVVKNADGEEIATTPLTQCKYACRVK